MTEMVCVVRSCLLYNIEQTPTKNGCCRICGKSCTIKEVRCPKQENSSTSSPKLKE